MPLNHMLKKYYAQSSDQDDLISIGTIGLIKGISSFDPSKGARLATYAARCIENEILMYFRSQKKLQGEVSLSETIESDREGNALQLMDVIGDPAGIRGHPSAVRSWRHRPPDPTGDRLHIRHFPELCIAY